MLNRHSMQIPFHVCGSVFFHFEAQHTHTKARRWRFSALMLVKLAAVDETKSEKEDEKLFLSRR